MKEIRQILHQFGQFKGQDLGMVLATVVNIEDSSYRRVGARMLILENGAWVGGISGGCLEGDVLKKAKLVMSTGLSRLISYDTRDGDPYQIGAGLGCEGKIDIFLQTVNSNNAIIKHLKQISTTRKNEVLLLPFRSSKGEAHLNTINLHQENLDLNIILDHVFSIRRSITKNIFIQNSEVSVLFEWIEPNTHLIVIGHNYDVYPVMAVAGEMGWDITLICNKNKIDKSRLTSNITLRSYSELDSIIIDNYTAIISMAHDYKKDKYSVEFFGEKPFGYFGVLGPRKRFIRMCKEENLNEEYIEKIHNPAGLDIGSRVPEEIALAIISEIVTSFRGASGNPLKNKVGYIHERAL